MQSMVTCYLPKFYIEMKKSFKTVSLNWFNWCYEKCLLFSWYSIWPHSPFIL